MSGSTENLLRGTHLGESVESIDKAHENTTNNERRLAHKEQNKGIVNPGFVGDVKNVDELKYSSLNKRATSLKQGSSSPSFPTRSRRHSSPDYDYNNNIKHKPRHGLSKHHRTASASEDDLRKKAVLNSIKVGRKYQSVSHLPNNMQREKDSQERAEDSANNAAKQSGDKNLVKGENNIKRVEVDNSETLERYQTSTPISTSPRQHQDSKDVLVALERAQLEQYKRRLTMALSERAKLTEQLKFLSAHVTQNLSRSFDNELDSPSLASTPRVGHSPRKATVDTSTPRYPALVGNTNELSLPPLPAQRKTKTIEKFHLEDIHSSRYSEPTYETRVIDAKSAANALKLNENNNAQEPRAKYPESTESIQKNTGYSDNDSKESRVVRKKENLSKKADDIWNKHLVGETFSSEDTQIDEDTSDSVNTVNIDTNNTRKKLLTVEEFLSTDEKKDEKKQDYEELDENDKEIRRVLETTTRHTPELYEPLVYMSSTQQHLHHDKSTLSSRNTSKDIESKHKYYEVDPNYQEVSTLKLGDNTRQIDTNHYEEMSSNDSPSLKYTRQRRGGDQTFSYMNPPGAAFNRQKNNSATPGSQGDLASVERAPSDISEKLRYYRGTLGNKNEPRETSHDLADAFANEKDPEKRREIQQLAAAEAAVLRREASVLLFEAMNLERICDPNARVRHIYLPQ